MKNNKPFSALHFGFLLLSVGFTFSCGVFTNATPGVSPASPDKAFSNSSTFQTGKLSPSQKPKTTSTLLSTRLSLPTSTRSTAVLTVSERSQFRITFDYGSDAIWERLYPAYTRLESAGYSVVRYSNSEVRNSIGYGDPSCLPAIEDIQTLVSDLVDFSGFERKQFGTDDLAYEKKEIAIQVGDESAFLQPAPTQDSSFAPYLAPLLPENAVARLGKSALDGAAVSPSGEDLAVATPIGVYMYHMEKAGSLREKWFVPTTIPMTTVVFSPDGKTLACGSYNDLYWLDDPEPASTIVLLLDSATGTPLQIFPIGERGSKITRLVYSPHGDMLAVDFIFSQGETGTIDTGVIILDLQSGKSTVVSLLERHEADQSYPFGVDSLAFSPDESILAVGYSLSRSSDEREGTVLLLNPATGESIRALGGHAGEVRDVAFSPDGKLLASADSQGAVLVWDASRWEKIRSLAAGPEEGEWTSYYCRPAESVRLLFSPDGKILSTGMRDGRIHLWNAGSGSKIRTLSGQTSGILALAFSADGAGVTSVSFDRSVVSYKISGGAADRRYSLDEHVRMASVAFSPDGSTLAGGDECSGVRVWDAINRKSIRTFPKGPFAYSPDGRTLATAGENNSIVLWDTAAWKQKAVLRGHTDDLYSIAFSPDGKTLASSGADKSLILWDTITGKKRWALSELGNWVSNLAFSPDGKTLAHSTGDSPSDIIFRDPATGEIRETLGAKLYVVYRVVYSPDGNYLAVVSFSGMTAIYGLPDYKYLSGPDGGTDAAISPDGSIGASGSEDIYFKTVFLWDPDSGKVIRTLPGHTSLVVGVAFSPDGKTLASASLDGTILLWDPASALGR